MGHIGLYYGRNSDFFGCFCAIDNKTIKVTFNKAVEGFTNQDITITSPTGAGVGTNTNFVVTEISDKEYQVRLDAEMGIGEYTATLRKDAVEDENEVKTALQYVKFQGTAAKDVTAPVVSSAEYNALTKKITVVFSEDVKAASLDKTKLSVTNGTTSVALTANETANFTDAHTLVLTLAADKATAVAALAGDLSLDVAEGAVADTSDNKIAAVKGISLSPTAQLQTASYDAASNVLTVNFTKDVKVNTLNVADLAIQSSAGTTALDANDVISTTTNGKSVSIKLKEDAGTVAFEGSSVTNRKVVLTTNANFVTTNDKQVQSSTVDVTFTKDATAATLVSSSYNATTKRLVLNFSEPVKADAAAIGTKVTITDAVNTSTGAAVPSITLDVADMETAANTYSNTLTFLATTVAGAQDNSLDTLTDDIALTSKSKVYFAKDAFVDGSGNKNAALSADNAVAISYLDQTAPQVGGSATQLSKNTFSITFNKEVTKDSAESIANYAITAAGANGLTVKSVSLLSDGVTAIITTNEEVSVGTNYVVAVSNVISKYGSVKVDSANDEATFTGSNTVSTAAPALTDVKFTDVDGDYDVNKGDTLTLKYDRAVVLNGVTKDDYAISVAGTTFGTGATFTAGANSDEIIVTLGENEDIAFGSRLTQVGTVHIKSVTGVNAAAGGNDTVDKPDTTEPEITKAVFADAAVDGKVSAGDTVTLTFSEALDRSVSASSILGAGALSFADGSDNFGAGATAEYLDSKTLRVTLGSSPQLNAAGIQTHINSATIAFAATDSVKDLWGNAGDAAQTPVNITSEDETRATIQSVEVVKGDGNTATNFEIGDKIKFTLSEEVDVVANASAGDIVAYKGTTPVASQTTTGAFTVNGKVVTFTLTATDAALIAEQISDITSLNFAGAGAAKITDAAGNTAKPAVGFGVSPK